MLLLGIPRSKRQFFWLESTHQTPSESGFPTEETLQDIVFELYDLMRALVLYHFFLKVLVALDGFKC